MTTIENYDKKIKASKKNKDDEELIIFRNIDKEELTKGYYKNVARYKISTDENNAIGVIIVTVCNELSGDLAEIEYYTTDDKYKNKGNISISLEEVLKDIFINDSLNGLDIRPFGNKSNIETAFLAITEENIPSQKVAEKVGFKKLENQDVYKINKTDFIIKKEQELDGISPDLEENKVYGGI